MKKFDYIIAGGGLSGLLLAYRLTQEFPNKKILLIEKNDPQKPFSRQWSYWTNANFFFDKVVKKRWSEFGVYDKFFTKEYKLNDYQFQLIFSHDFFNFIWQALSQNKNLEYVQKNILQIFKNGKVVCQNDSIYQADLVFDSTYKEQKVDFFISGWQWEIETNTLVNDKKIHFLDYRSTDLPGSFFYLLPLNQKKIFLTLTFISKKDKNIPRKYREKILKQFLHQNLNIKDFKIISQSFSGVPINSKKAKRQNGKVFLIGNNAGLLKPSTSYALVKIVLDTEQIIESLKKNSLPKQKSSNFLSSADKLLTSSFIKHPTLFKKITLDLFKNNNDGDKILAFLNEQLTPKQSFQLVKKINPLEMIIKSLI